MKDGGRLSAAIEVLTEVETRHRPVQMALRDWGTSHRFAGSGDRTAIGNLVFDALRHRASLSARLSSDTPRMAVLGTYALTWRNGTEGLQAAFEADSHAPEPATEDEISALTAAADIVPEGAAAADVPAWLWESFQGAFGEKAEAEGQALATRAPIDLRVNTLKSDREKLLKKLSHINASASALTPTGIRVVAKPGAARMPHVQAEEGYQKGWFELQDEGSQLVSLLGQAKPGQQVLDFCAGGGGKTLALAASMGNKGQIFAYDAERLRLAPIHDRLKRAGVHSVQVKDPATTDLKELEGAMDLVFIDAPCTGTGVWRRRPDSKWKLSEKALSDRLEDQIAVLDRACKYVRPGGRLVYVTCSVLPQENTDQITAFLERNSEFEALSALEIWKQVLPECKEPEYVNERGDVLLTPATMGTDGFFAAVMTRKA
ncbi:RsmB/NOP family class I SAM-dependent RNA methyltransferase [Roseibium limicola]|uniref:RsmB/NOP family class I SAM-dependent RNA methyltransferase n=1 Tax=Roseibium limicola TaxID=2816037 RepID=A0A939EKT3_9HYPH|nr:RsmB/NOP family class I SAM-dependent RNA methyltransferase [Roseibium limicola]MBO0344399.1 RsmB/NOP family class I SAM-dependent RNA methyltransferase [Roseibium limicola]